MKNNLRVFLKDPHVISHLIDNKPDDISLSCLVELILKQYIHHKEKGDAPRCNLATKNTPHL